jgi:hypothetical protein
MVKNDRIFYAKLQIVGSINYGSILNAPNYFTFNIYCDSTSTEI